MIEPFKEFQKESVYSFDFFDLVKTRFEADYKFERFDDSTLFLKTPEAKSIWKLDVTNTGVIATCRVPLEMSDDDADEFYNAIHNLLY